MRAQSTKALCPASLFWLGVSFPTTPSQLGRIQSVDTKFANSCHESLPLWDGSQQGKAGRAQLGLVPGSHPERVTNVQRCFG